MKKYGARYWPWKYLNPKKPVYPNPEHEKKAALRVLKLISKKIDIYYLDEVKFYLLRDNSCFIASRSLIEKKEETIVKESLVQMKIEIILMTS